MRDEDGRGGAQGENRTQLFDELRAKRSVQVVEWLVEQQHTRSRGQRPRDRGALRLAARHLVRETILRVAHPHQLDDRVDAPLALPFRQAPQPERDVLPERQMRQQRGVLKDHADVALLRRQRVPAVGHPDLADVDRPRVELLEAGHQP